MGRGAVRTGELLRMRERWLSALVCARLDLMADGPVSVQAATMGMQPSVMSAVES